jgi:hypothetical protein
MDTVLMSERGSRGFGMGWIGWDGSRLMVGGTFTRWTHRSSWC